MPLTSPLTTCSQSQGRLIPRCKRHLFFCKSADVFLYIFSIISAIDVADHVAGPSTFHPADPNVKDEPDPNCELIGQVLELGFEEPLIRLAISKTKGFFKDPLTALVFYNIYYILTSY